MKNIHKSFSVVVLIVLFPLFMSCDNVQDRDLPEENVEILNNDLDVDDEIVKVFTGRVVDAQGIGISGVLVHALVNTDSGELLELTTDDEGGFSVTEYGELLLFHRLDYDENHGWLYEKVELEASLTSEPTAIRSNQSFSFAEGPNGDGYLPDPRSPAIFVLLKRGERPVVWPSRGGRDRVDGSLRENEPWRPDFPSLPWIERTDRVEDYLVAASTSDVVDFEFWGLVVDGDGTPVPGAVVQYLINEAVPVEGIDQWGRGMVIKEFEIRADEDGRFQIEGNGEYLQFKDIRLGEFRWYTSIREFNPNGSFNQNSIYRFVENTEEQVYIPDPESPAIFVIGNMLGGTPAAWPSRGGQDRIDGTLYENAPVKPIQAAERWFD